MILWYNIGRFFCGNSPLPRWQNEARFHSESGLLLPIQPKGIMRLEEEARELQRLIEDSLAKGLADLSDPPDITELRARLRDGVFELEELLKSLPQRQREVAYVLYVQKIRQATCVVHMAVDSVVNKNTTGENPPDEAMFADNPNVVPSWHYIANLYG